MQILKVLNLEQRKKLVSSLKEMKLFYHTLLKSLIDWCPLTSLKPGQMVQRSLQQLYSSVSHRNAKNGPNVQSVHRDQFLSICRCGSWGPIFATYYIHGGTPQKADIYNSALLGSTHFDQCLIWYVCIARWKGWRRQAPCRKYIQRQEIYLETENISRDRKYIQRQEIYPETGNVYMQVSISKNNFIVLVDGPKKTDVCLWLVFFSL